MEIAESEHFWVPHVLYAQYVLIPTKERDAFETQRF